ncbi:MAG: hypothetical protein U9R74_00890 [Pseudomonadota bacterium]|nr:hypothetical protein [Pseudomonadota bacterium]
MKELWRDFYNWLDSARIGEIFSARDRAYEKTRELRSKDPDTRRDLRRMVRLMDEELVMRSELAAIFARWKERPADRPDAKAYRRSPGAVPVMHRRFQ